MWEKQHIDFAHFHCLMIVEEVMVARVGYAQMTTT
jgi:hypothetical protein